MTASRHVLFLYLSYTCVWPGTRGRRCFTKSDCSSCYSLHAPHHEIGHIQHGMLAKVSCNSDAGHNITWPRRWLLTWDTQGLASA
ncbi:hypothetical protein COO60DRAFT_1502413 [Scenedesmus sp. NREL 46B-D3]|nr:hypothetical protein COO60DRAFT_1502413 [Scenedesmus sp. NREL 46B-D3]